MGFASRISRYETHRNRRRTPTSPHPSRRTRRPGRIARRRPPLPRLRTVLGLRPGEARQGVDRDDRRQAPRRSQAPSRLRPVEATRRRTEERGRAPRLAYRTVGCRPGRRVDRASVEGHPPSPSPFARSSSNAFVGPAGGARNEPANGTSRRSATEGVRACPTSSVRHGDGGSTRPSSTSRASCRLPRCDGRLPRWAEHRSSGDGTAMIGSRRSVA
jgi:hypothetical protein